jgi:hypothetical protein
MSFIFSSDLPCFIGTSKNFSTSNSDILSKVVQSPNRHIYHRIKKSFTLQIKSCLPLNYTSKNNPNSCAIFSLPVLALDSTQLDSARLNLTRLNSTRLDSTWLDSTRLDSTQLHSTRLDSTRLDSTRLDSTRLKPMTSRWLEEYSTTAQPRNERN